MQHHAGACHGQSFQPKLKLQTVMSYPMVGAEKRHPHISTLEVRITRQDKLLHKFRDAYFFILHIYPWDKSFTIHFRDY